MTQTDNDALVRGLEAWLHRVDDQDIAYFGTVVLAALRSPAPVVDEPLGPMLRCPACGTKSQQVHDVDAYLGELPDHGLKEPIHPYRNLVAESLVKAAEATRPQPAQDELGRQIAREALIASSPNMCDLMSRVIRGGSEDDRPDLKLAITAAITALRQHNDVAAITKPWADFHGDLPDYDHPMRPVYESGIQYAVALLAKMLKVDDYEVCDGTEEFDGDLGGTLFNIVLAAMPKDQDGDPIHPADLRQHSGESALREENARLQDELDALKAERKSQTNDEGLLPCPKCEGTSAYLYWWQRGQAWIVICRDCKHEANARESHEYQARDIWNAEARAALGGGA